MRRTLLAFALAALIAAPASAADAAKPQPPDFAPLFNGQRAVLLECLQWELAHRWMQTERAKGQIGDWKKMRIQGQAEFATLNGYLKAADAARRIDLARFVLRTNAAVLQSEMTPVFWTGGSHGYGHVALSRGDGTCCGVTSDSACGSTSATTCGSASTTVSGSGAATGWCATTTDATGTGSGPPMFDHS